MVLKENSQSFKFSSQFIGVFP